MNARITVSLMRSEKSALMQLAERERRDPRAQAAILIRRELERLGLIQRLEVVTDERHPA